MSSGAVDKISTSEYDVVKGSLSICRICLSIDNQQLTNLFEPKSDPLLTSYHKLTACIPSLNITELDPYPHHICNECSYLLDKSYDFYLLCTKSDQKLRYPDLFDLKIEPKDELESEILPETFVDQIFDNKPIEIVKVKRRPKKRPRNKKKSIRNLDESKSTRNRRIRKKQIPKFECDICGKMMLGKFALEQHLRIHTGERPFVCEMCGKAYQTLGCVNKHRTTHDKNRFKQFKCTKCQYKTDQINLLKRHELTHTEGSSLECELCEKKFKTSEYLYNHRRKLHVEPSFSCDFCDEKFRTNGKLRRHAIRHYRSAVYQCNQCTNCYSSQSGLIQHMKSRHPGIKWPLTKESRIINTSLVAKINDKPDIEFLTKHTND